MSIEVIKKYFEPKSILDIGANIGQFYNESKIIFPDAYYYLVEGNERCEVVLETLGVDYSISLLSDIEKDVDFYIRKDEPRCTGNSIYRENTPFYDDDQIIIQQKRTQTLSKLLNNQTFDLIKIDVQGSEIDIINGGIDIIKKSKGILMEVSIVEYNKNSPTKEYVYEFMKTLNFYPAEHISDINHPITHHLIQQDILFIKNE
jgi:FkbM family methyltransferase